MTRTEPYATAEGPCLVLIEGLELPVRYDQRVTVLDAMVDQFQDLLDEQFELSPDWVMGRGGYRYASIPPVCPDCSSDLGFSRPLLDSSNGAVADATCHDSCGWEGNAVYRLIDLAGSDGGPEQSIVAEGSLQPAYRPY